MEKLERKFTHEMKGLNEQLTIMCINKDKKNSVKGQFKNRKA